MMNQEDIFRKIGLILEELQDQYAYLARNQQQLNELELELFMANANFLSDHVQIVRKLNTAKILKEIPEHTSPDPAAETTASNDQINWESPSATQQNWNPATENVNVQNSVQTLPEVLEVEPPVAEVNSSELEEKPLVEDSNELFTESTIEKETFKLDKEPSTFEFILKDIGATDKFEFEEKSVDDIFDRPLSEEEEQIIAQKQKLKEQEALEQANETKAEREDELGPEPFLVAKEEPIVPAARTEFQVDPIAEKIADEKTASVTEASIETPVASAKPLSLNERLASQLGTKLNTTNTDPQRNTLTDLKHGINLNDKMLYIKDLFNGYNLAYAEVIELLNKMPDFKTADSFLQNNYAEKNNWAAKSSTVAKFYELLNQRFPTK